ncbi:hypothetical protein P3T23_009595, partial [Paraburkholderia sp. GAS448]
MFVTPLETLRTKCSREIDLKLSAVSVEQFRQFGIDGFLRPG